MKLNQIIFVFALLSSSALIQANLPVIDSNDKDIESFVNQHKGKTIVMGIYYDSQRNAQIEHKLESIIEPIASQYPNIVFAIEYRKSLGAYKENPFEKGDFQFYLFRKEYSKSKQKDVLYSGTLTDHYIHNSQELKNALNSMKSFKE